MPGFAQPVQIKNVHDKKPFVAQKRLYGSPAPVALGHLLSQLLGGEQTLPFPSHVRVES